MPLQLLSTNPGGNSRLATPDSNIVLTFNGNVQTATGTVALKTIQGVVIESFNLATSPGVKIAGATLTIDPTANLAAGALYTLEAIGMAISDQAGDKTHFSSALLTAFKATPANLLKQNGTSGAEQYEGTNGNDLIYLLDGNDTAIGVRGDDVIYGGAGNDNIWAVYGGQSPAAGDDYFDGGPGDDYIQAGSGNDILIGAEGKDSLNGGDGNDILDGGAGEDELKAGSGDDILYGGDGKDVLHGGLGNDTAVFPLARSAYTLLQDGPAWLVTNISTKVTSVLASVEKIKFPDQTITPAAFVDFSNASVDLQKSWVTQSVDALQYTGKPRIAGNVISYSFEAASFATPNYLPAGEAYAYQMVNSHMQTFLRETFDYLERVLNVSFVEKASGTGAQIKIGAHNMTADVGGYATPPNRGETAGNLLISSKEKSDTLGQRIFGYAVHELGHVLGLDHTQNRSALGLTENSNPPDVPLAFDTGAFSVMSYQHYSVNGGRFSTFAPLDIAALQALYGKNPKINDSIFTIQYDPALTGKSVDTLSLASTSKNMGLLHNFGETVSTIYAYSPTMIVDTGGNDLIDLTGFLAPATVDLSKGAIYRQEFLSGTVLVFDAEKWVDLDLTQPIVRIEPFTVIEKVTGTKFNDSIIGTGVAETLNGAGGNDVLDGGGGNDVLDGGAGRDTALFGGITSSYTVAFRQVNGNTTYTVKDKSGAYGTDTLQNIEVLKFADKSINLTIQAQAKAAPAADVTRLSELYIAFFNRVPDADGLSYWIGQKVGGLSINQIAENFYNAGVQYSSLTGFSASMSNTAFIDVIYKNVLGRAEGADAGGLAFWNAKLIDGSATRGSLVSTILDSAHTFKGNKDYGYVADLLDNKIAVAQTFAIDWGLNYNTASDSITNGMAIAAAITPTSTAAAISLIGVDPTALDLV